MKTKILTLCISLLACVTYAQKNVTKFFPTAAVGQSPNYDNLHQILKGYLAPIAEDYGQLTNNGWYTTAAVHKQWGFDFNVTVNTISIKSDAKTFDVPALTGVMLSESGPIQTAYGKEGVKPQFTFTQGSPNAGLSFLGADGAEPDKDLPVGSLAIPTFQLGLGVFKGTDLYVRFTPAIKVSDTEAGNWGVGIKHDIKQYIPAIKELPFSISVFGGYTKGKATTDLSGYYDGSGQEGVAETSSYTVQLLVGKAIKVVTFYAGLGFNSSTTDYSIDGTYQVNKYESVQGGDQSLNAPITLTNPYSDSFTKSGFRGTAGIRFKFGPVSLNTDYTLVSKRSLLTAGFGFTFDKKIN